ncbi:MAG: mercury resistance system transport protein MerF [Alphaproteobacteria bacterium]
MISLGAVGLSAGLAWLDYVLFPAMAVFMGIVAYGLYLRRGATL